MDSPTPGGAPLRMAAVGECMLEVAASGFGPARLGFGGDALNTAVYLRRSLGEGDRVHFVTVLGRDPWSERMLARWRAEGLDTELVLRSRSRVPGIYLIHADEHGERSFLYWRERSAARTLLDGTRPRRLEQALGAMDWVYLTGITLAILPPAGRARMLAMLERLKASGTRIAFDPNFRPRLWRRLPGGGTGEGRRDADPPQPAGAWWARMGTLADLVLTSIEDERLLWGSGEGAEGGEAGWRWWLSTRVPELVLKRGPEPVRIALGHGGGRRRVEEVAALPVASVLDTTAAGDAFNAAYLAARARGLSPADAACRGHALAARVIGHRGALIPRPGAGEGSL